LPQSPAKDLPATAQAEETEGADERPLRLRADATGNLVKDAAARSGIERVAALYSGNQGLGRLREAVAALPPAAQQQAQHLYHQWKQYSAAIPQALPPPQDDTPPDEQEIQRQLDVLHQLRVTHFGAEAAQSMFGEEEQMARQVLERMRLQTDPGLSPAEKAERALRSLSPQKLKQ
jgi:lipase chaperone LimK